MGSLELKASCQCCIISSMTSSPPSLSEDTIDDLLYFSRTADADALQATLNGVSKDLAAPPHDILAAAVDAESGNTALHMAAANGHTGGC